ncbi:MAG: YdcF family protein [Candidatus Electrothrix sp. GW3-4]|uniref:YdcF family protein n=1 Tax=Candidatus Electrothrix sp. GW3-4 TaxID=3126740 RepID=UPI0030CB3D36
MKVTARLLIFFWGILCGGLLVLATGVLFLRYAPLLLLVDEPVTQADIAVVLGGGGGSRLHKGLALYKGQLVDHLVLVDKTKQDWAAMLQRLCPNYVVEGKITILEGSRNTFTDAELAEAYCRAHNIKNMLVVTDPYHTRRAALIFKEQFAENNVQVRVVSSGEFGNRLTPQDQWWQDENTLKTVWAELSKIFIILLRKYEFCSH